jgi:hypothetical protein
LHGGKFNLHGGRLDIDPAIGVLEQGRFHLERGNSMLTRVIGDLHQGITPMRLQASLPKSSPNWKPALPRRIEAR